MFFTWLLLVVVVGLIGYRRYAQHESAALFNAFLANHRALVEKNQDNFANDRDLALEIRTLSVPTHNKDAGARLNGWVAWPGQGGAKNSGLAGFAKSPEALTDLRKKLASWGKTWPSVTDAKEALKSFDFSWMKELRAFDHWKLDDAPPVKAALSARQGVLPAEIPTPDLGSFSTWVELRLLLGIQQVQLADAIADTSQLATLLISTESLPLADVGIGILSKQLQAAQYYKKSIDPKFDLSQLPSAEAIQAASRVLQKGDLFFSVFTDHDVIADLYANDKPDALGCAIANSHGPWIVRSKLVVGDLFGENLKIITRVLHKEWKDCGLARLRPFWDNEKATTSDLAADPFVPPYVPELSGFQFVYPIFDFIAQFSRRDQGLLPPIMEYSSAIRRAMGIAWARQNEPSG